MRWHVLTDAARRMAHYLEDLLFPPLCLHCREPVETSPVPGLCPTCLNRLKPVLPGSLQTYVLDRLLPCHLDALWAAFQFDEIMRDILHGIKYARMPDLGYRMGEFAAARLADFVDWEKDEGVCVIPIPLHPRRVKEREYNQSHRIARGVFTEHPEWIYPEVLVRERYTRSQTRLNRDERRLNVRNAFRVVQPHRVRGKTVVLVDDVITTGATMNECARQLKLQGATRVVGVALASPLREEDNEDGKIS